jgi:hypothetical protein
VVGFLLFAAIVLASLSYAWRAARARGPSVDRNLSTLAEGTILALIAVLVANFFAPGLFDKQMWLLLAIGPALFTLSRAAGASDGRQPAPTP